MTEATYAAVVDLLHNCYSRSTIATYLGLDCHRYRDTLRTPGMPKYRRPPSDWRNRLRPLIRDAAWWYGTHADEGAVSLLTQAMEPE